MNLFSPVTVYGQPSCKPCERVKSQLEEAGVEFEYVDISANDEARTYVTGVLKARSTPVIVTDAHDPIIGYDTSKIRSVIEYYTASETGL
ncbi:NrdH-like glutaredoxin [Gordonia phage Strosahl]|uniref:NrdH-like glutaredoxin n=2 Tax=Soupsvirus strosahl TaxID=2560510 RepID=A0A1B3B189_9CAUD|nr:NrdH-like glutaredoxin [Gordonia phage Remus]YP_009596265.1 NrdH-like glutaredoxin [Gordonia phage Strosahl]AOE44674.1 NrdH-like glutaredoxin [Gordonia phage Remus]AOE44775.1 NrdH-like glutaredoxin [Gordonia phage Strosahl]QZD98711.1 NrdH-like glutaredoxin [Gordonia phage Looper]